ncbi:MAG TPA: glycosyltransferase family 4 protein [Candidatus Paceibacterota bacterium]
MENTPKKKKILYIITKSNFGGAQRHVFDLATNMPKDQYDVVVAAGGKGLLHEKLKAAGIKTISIGLLGRDASILKDSFSFLTIFRIIRSEKPAILHLHSPKAGGLGALSGRILRVPRIVFTAHGWTYKENRPSWQKILIYTASWLTVFLCHKAIVVSKDDFKKAPTFMIKDKIEMIHNGIAQFECLPRVEAQKEIFGNAQIHPEILILGCIAELHKNKGLAYAIKAIADIRAQNADRNRPILFGIIGDGDEKENLKKLVRESEIENSVFFAGYKESAQKLMSAFDLFIFPSLKEGLPYSLLEAGGIGLPLIATDVGGAADIITDMETGILIRPKNIKEVSNAMRYFIQNPEKIAEFGGKLKKRISEEFSLEKMVEKTIVVYESR